jgi:hypothetical protein
VVDRREIRGVSLRIHRGGGRPVSP